MTTRALYEQRAKLLADMRATLDRADAEKRALSSDEEQTYTRMETDLEALSATITRSEELAALEREYTVPESQRTATESRTERRDEVNYETSLRSYLRNGFQGMSSDEQRILQTGYRSIDEARAQSTLSGAAGGFVVAPDTSFYGRVIEALKFFGGMFNAGCTELVTSTGAELPIATDDDTSNTGSIVSEEGSHASGTNVSLSQKTLRAYLYSSKEVKISWQLLQDAAVDFEGYLARKLGQRLARIQNTHLTTGDSINKPYGIVNASTQGVQAATGNTTSVPADNLIDLVHSVDPAYRQGARFMMADSTVKILRKLKDGEGRYLWQMGLTSGDPSTLLGYPVVVNNDMAVAAASAKTILFGDFSNYYIRRVRDVQVIRLNELYASNGQVAFLAWMRLDGNLIDAGQNPVKHFAHSAS